MELVIARSPDPDSSLPYLLRLPLGDGLVFRTKGTWPRTSALYCHPVTLDEWPADPEVVERVPLRSCARRGAAIDVVADRAREHRSQVVFTVARGREMVFWQSPRTRKQARPDVRLPTARAAGIAELEIVVDVHERYAYSFLGQQVRTTKRGLACGGYAVEVDGQVVAAVERKSLTDLVSSLTSGRLRFALTELATLPRAAVVVEDRYPSIFKQEWARPAVVADGLAELQVRWSSIPIVFCDNRKTAAAQALSAVPAVASTTVGGLARRFTPDRVAGIEAGNAEVITRGWERLPERRRAAVLAGRVSIDLDATDVEVYGRLKRGVAYNYQGQRCGRPHLATWAGTGLTLAADLLTGVQDVRAHSSALLRRAITALPADVREGFDADLRPVVRADAGYFAAELAYTALGLGCDFAVAARRNPALWRAAAGVGEQEWSPAIGMHAAQVAVSDYAPAGWPPHTYTLIRRVRVDADTLSTDPRSRRRRTIDRDQLTLALDGHLDCVWATSFIVTNLPTGGDGFDTATDVEAWFRMRTDIEDRIREAKLGAGMLHMPSGYAENNTVWMWAALIAGNLSTLLQAITGIDTGEPGRAHGDRLRHELLQVPARVIRHARRLILRLPPGHNLLPQVMATLRALPAPSG